MEIILGSPGKLWCSPNPSPLWKLSMIRPGLPLGISKSLRRGGMDIFWNYSLWYYSPSLCIVFPFTVQPPTPPPPSTHTHTLSPSLPPFPPLSSLSHSPSHSHSLSLPSLSLPLSLSLSPSLPPPFFLPSLPCARFARFSSPSPPLSPRAKLCRLPVLAWLNALIKG